MPEHLQPGHFSHDTIAAAHSCLRQLGGFNGNGADEIAPTASALALIAIAEELRELRIAVAALSRDRP